MAYKIGETIPTFSLLDHNSEKIDSDDLLGSPFVLYFYPKDNTPGCTKEACDFRDRIEDLDNLDALVIGISPDSPESHSQFIKQHWLNFTLLSDPNFQVSELFGAVKQKQNLGSNGPCILRSTFVVDAEGKIRWIEQPVSVEGHADRVLAALHEIAS